MENKEIPDIYHPIDRNPFLKKPTWLKSRLPSGEGFLKLKSLVKKHGLNTVCEAASCPNQGTCWNTGTLTLMILGDICTRACGFCDVSTGRPLAPRDSEPDEVATVLSRLDLHYTVITSVDRDDLPDGGAVHWARTIRAVRYKCPDLKLEALIPDFKAINERVDTVCQALPDVLAHNLETVASLTAKVRPQSRYEWSLKTLERAGKYHGLIIKSGLMLGLGETRREVIQAFDDLLSAGCKIISLGQYLQPSRNHLPIKEFIPLEIFAEYKNLGESMGFSHVEAGPLVRSSYQADQQARMAGL